MKVDALVIGAELDGLVAAIRLAELGASVGLVANGASSLHYAAGGMRVLGYVGEPGARRAVEVPLRALAHLEPRHPYALAGEVRVREALDWFDRHERVAGTQPAMDGADGRNVMALTPAGLLQPILRPARHQATLGRLRGRHVAIVQIAGHRDFHATLLAAGLASKGCRVDCVAMAAPGTLHDNAGLARDFDRLPDPGRFFAALRSQLPAGCEFALMPAVLGLDRHDDVVAAARDALGIEVLEVPTVPPSVPGMRMARRFEASLQSMRRCTVRRNVRIVTSDAAHGRVRSVADRNGRRIAADRYVLATGGVLMGGLDVDPDGAVRETALGLDVVQSRPLEAGTPAATLAALHRCGIETDAALRPIRNGAIAAENVHVTGRTLAHWDPAAEISAEGVSIVTGWLAAECAATGEGS